jgi:hypothetical protein
LVAIDTFVLWIHHRDSGLIDVRLIGAIMNAATTVSQVHGGANAAQVDMRFEVAVIPVADVDRSKEFYTKLGWRLDADFPFDNGFRVVQFTPMAFGLSSSRRPDPGARSSLA